MARLQAPSAVPRDVARGARSHVTLPVPANDPVYGASAPAGKNERIWLGHAALYGERDMLLMPEAVLLRPRYNLLPVDDAAHRPVPGKSAPMTGGSLRSNDAGMTGN